MSVRTYLVPAVLVVAVGAVVVGAFALRSTGRDKLLETAGRANEPAGPVVAAAPTNRSGVMRAEAAPEPVAAAPEAKSAANTENETPDDRRRRFRRPSLGDKPMSAEDWAKRWVERQSRRKEWMDRFDTDGDGQISDAEREAMRAEMRARRDEFMLRRMTSRFDADGDGVLSDAERVEAEAELAVRRAEREARMTERFDTDGDGKLSDSERRAIRDQFGPSGRGGGRDTVSRYDANGDGELDLDESYEAYLDQFRARQERLFIRRYDTGDDGTVDAGDLEAFLTTYREKEPTADINEDGVIDQHDVERFRDLMAASP